MIKSKMNEKSGGEFIPVQIIDNISPSEEILHQAKWHYTSPTFKISIYAIFGLEIVSSIFLLIAFSRGNTIIIKFGPIFLFVYPLAFILMFFMFKISPYRKEFFLVITDKKLYLYTKTGRVDSIDSINLTSIKAALFKKKRFIKKSKDLGKIVLISTDLKKYQKNKIEIQNIKNLKFTYQKFESILWHYGNLKERIETFRNNNNIFLPYTFKIEQQTFNKITRYGRIFTILLIICIVAIGIGFMGIFLQMHFIIIINLLVFGSGFVVMSLVFRFMIKNILTPIMNQLNLEEDKIVLIGEEFSETIFFNDKVNLDFHQIQDFKKSSIGTYEILGAIIVKESIDSLKMIKFGPIFEFYNFLEVCYLHLLNWKGEQGLLLEKDQLQYIKKEKFRDVVHVVNTEQKKAKLEEVYLDNEILTHVRNYLEKDEQILFKYKPEYNIKKNIIIGIAGIFSFILLLLIPFVSINFFIITIFILIFPITFGFLALCVLPGKLMEKKSVYIFTNQKIIIKYPKQFLITKINNISSIKRINKRNRYHIVINLKNELENSPFIDKGALTIQNIPKDNILIDRVKNLRELEKLK